MDPNITTTNSNNNEGSGGDDTSMMSKRQAMTGQWRTPPLPVFAAAAAGGQPMPPQPSVVGIGTTTSQQQQQQPPPGATTTTIQLPESTDDYTKALQEAYRRGAEAAAAMQQQQHLPNAVSCPNFHGHHYQPQTTTGSTTTTAVADTVAAATAPPSSSVGIGLPTHQLGTTTTTPTTTTTTTLLTTVPNPLTTTAGTTATTMAGGAGAVATASSHHTHDASRSFSLPDMASYAARAQAEEEKRKKRLARNRASARLRRLRKKNLVDSYEGEVGVLELSLQKLKAHEWGMGHSHEALLEALSMERGQQALGLEERQTLVQDILKQQRDQLAYLREAQLEQQVLKELVMQDRSGRSHEEEMSSSNNSAVNNDLWQELEGVLNLTQEQKDSLLKATSGLDEEVEAMETLETCLEAMQGRLTNDSVHNLTSQFMNIFHSNQIQKFLLWADANAEAIDQLDYCHAGPPANSPIFSFGMDDYGGASQLHFNTNTEEDTGA